MTTWNNIVAGDVGIIAPIIQNFVHVGRMGVHFIPLNTSGVAITDGSLNLGTALNPWGDIKRWGFHPARPFAFSFYDTKGNSLYIRWKVNPKTREVLTNKKDIKLLRKILEDESMEEGTVPSFYLLPFKVIGGN